MTTATDITIPRAGFVEWVRSLQVIVDAFGDDENIPAFNLPLPADFEVHYHPEKERS
jgi:hypothetical protein